MYKLNKQSDISKARMGEIKTSHGILETPFFMTIATKAAVKTLDINDLQILDPQILLSNTYHLMLRPGMKLMQEFEGLHNFMNWHKPILTDSDGYPIIKTHAFGISSLPILNRYPWFSADSTTWGQHSWRGAIVVPRGSSGNHSYDQPLQVVPLSRRRKHHSNHFSNLEPDEQKRIAEIIAHQRLRLGL